MTEFGVMMLARVLAVQAQIEGMKAANATHMAEYNGLPMYSEDHFIGAAKDLQQIADQMEHIGVKR